MRTLLCLAAAGLLWTAPLPAQTLSLSGALDDPAAAIVGSILAADDYLLLDRDTVLDAETVVAGDLIVIGARVSLEGVVTGAVGVIEADFFVRPRGRVGGAIAVIGIGGAYLSGLAEVGEPVRLDPRIDVRLQREAGAVLVVLTRPQPPRAFRLPGAYGLTLPTYDRVNGLSIPLGAGVGFGGRDTATVLVSGQLTYRGARRRIDPSAAIALRPARGSLVTLAAGRYTRTTETWIRGDLANSLAAIGTASDVRDYFESDEISLALGAAPAPPLIQGEQFFTPRLIARISRDRSLENAAPWSLFGDRTDWRENLPIDEGTLASAVAGGTFGWRGPASELTGAAAVEWAPPGIGDFTFAQGSASVWWWMRALLDHQLRVGGYVLYPLGGREAPLQRWSFVGGPGTLPTHEPGHLRGDHVLFVNSVYFAPIPRVQVPVVGQPSLRLEHSVGTAWRTGDPVPPLEQNLGLGLQLSLFNVMVFIDPAERPRRFVTSFGARLPAAIALPIL